MKQNACSLLSGKYSIEMEVKELIMKTRFREKGALFVEYAMALAFVIVVGVVFIGNNGISDKINTIFGNTTNTLEIASGKPVGSKDGVLTLDWLHTNYADIKASNGIMTTRTSFVPTEKQQDMIDSFAKALGVPSDQITINTYNYGTQVVQISTDGNFNTETPGGQRVNTMYYYYDKSGNIEKIVSGRSRIIDTESSDGSKLAFHNQTDQVVLYQVP